MANVDILLSIGTPRGTVVLLRLRLESLTLGAASISQGALLIGAVSCVRTALARGGECGSAW
ncbi:MAG TPA: hypothetical protein VM580_02910 [Labilithrix sp.]|nr:hypothetical protein [Labilithrix sp.]